ncbi:MAG TPA: energy-coupling factor ABC transporter permease, partial [Leptolyngbyaceae cyanobacterium M65_K2018_010]|nr:energy-coupling factor ABC transporter permease [Leptolyngbyaceae cyanobacterium M65_K2018_010]
PALVAYHLFQARQSLGQKLPEPTRTAVFAFLGGALGLGLAALIFLSLVILNIPAEVDARAEQGAVLALSLGHVPLMVVEGLFTAILVLFLQRVKPELLGG